VVITVIAVGLCIALPLLYVLSVGPAVWLHHQGFIDASQLSTLYGPLDVVGGEPESWRNIYRWYASLFRGPPTPQPPSY
jgi:hypothetical protein